MYEMYVYVIYVYITYVYIHVNIYKHICVCDREKETLVLRRYLFINLS